jgi:uridine kinase
MMAFVIGIGGGSASGKSTVAKELESRLAPLRVTVVNQDRYFWETSRLPRAGSPDGGREWPDYNQPASFDLVRLRADVREMRQGEADVVILEGILVLRDEALRELMDLKLFVDADPDERIVRRLRRTVARGHDLGGICDYYLDSVRYRHQEFCEPTRAYADLIVPGGRYQREQAERVLGRIEEIVREAGARGRGPGASHGQRGRSEQPSQAP